MLGDIALRCPHHVDDLLHAGLTATDNAQDFQAQGMRDGLQRVRRHLNVFLLINQTDFEFQTTILIPMIADLRYTEVPQHPVPDRRRIIE